MTDELKPCPFCGGEAKWCGDDPEDKHECHFIVCKPCGYEFNFSADSNPDTLEELRSEVMVGWNRRQGNV